MWKFSRHDTVLRWFKDFGRFSTNKSSKSGKDENAVVCRENRFEVCQEFNIDNDKEKRQKEKKSASWKGKHCCHNLNNYFIETIGWLGTAFIVGFNVKQKLCGYHEYGSQLEKASYEYRRQTAFCRGLGNLLLKVFNMPYNGPCLKQNVLPYDKAFSSSSETNSEKDKDCLSKQKFTLESIGNQLEKSALNYLAAYENLAGVQLRRKEPVQAFEHFKHSAELGFVKGHFNVGVCYETGKGTKADLNKASYHYKQAADLGHGFATYNLGVFYMEGKGGLKTDPKTGHQLIRKAANQGVSEAQVFVGAHLYEQQKWEKAFHWFQRAAKEKNADAQFYLALCYENGTGVQSDYVKAAEFYSRAAENGHEIALYNLATYYEQGLGGLSKDLAQARELYSKAADAGLEEAKLALESLGTSFESENCADEVPKSSSILHASSSSPNLSANNNLSIPFHPSTIISQYLDLILPSSFRKCHPDKEVIEEEDELHMKMQHKEMLVWSTKAIPATGY